MTQPLRPQAFTLIELPKAVSRSAALTTRKGFTLIELLVVITIIVVLLALLTPALEKAVYQAQLVQCAAQQKSIASASTLYAMSNRRQYPTNKLRRDGGYKPVIIGTTNDPDRDLRPVVKDYIPIKSWVDPLCQPVDLSIEANGPTTTVESSFNYWAGWAYTNPDANASPMQSPMYRLGDRLGWLDNELSGRRQGPHQDKVSLLVGDRNDVHANNAYIESAHPDADGVLRSEVVRDAIGIAGLVTYSWWFDGQRNIPRGLVDLNFASEDGSVIRYAQVTGDWVSNDFEAADGTLFHGAPWHAQFDVGAKRFVPVR